MSFGEAAAERAEERAARGAPPPCQRHAAGPRTCEHRERDVLATGGPGRDREVGQEREAKPFLEHGDERRKARRGEVLLFAEARFGKGRERVALEAMAPLEKQAGAPFEVGAGGFRLV